MLHIIQKRLCLLRSNNITSFGRTFNRQSRNSKGFLQSNESANGISETLTSNLSAKCLVKPFIFTVTFSGSCFLAATIWQYEEMRKFAQSFIKSRPLPFESYGSGGKRSEVRRQINAWWNSQTEGQKIAASIIAINLGVFLMWRVPALYPFMTKYFSANPAIKGSCLPMLLSTFSHYSFFHFAANMYVLYSFSNSAVSFFGKEQFMALYCSAGVISSFASYAYKVAAGRLVTSLGASGALMAILSSMCFQFPDLQLQIIFVPFFTFSASQAIKTILALDFVGLIARWQIFDHAAHLGGALFGMWYLYYGREHIWNKREYVFKWYHNIREGKE